MEKTKVDVLTHINLGTGLISYSYRDDIDINDAVACLTTYAQAQDEFVQLPSVVGYNLDEYKMRAQVLAASDGSSTPGAAIIIFVGPEEELVMTTAITRRSSDGPDMWRILIESSQTSVRAVDYPSEPWVACIPEPGAVKHAAILPALAKVERTLAWAWIDYLRVQDSSCDDVNEHEIGRVSWAPRNTTTPITPALGDRYASDDSTGDLQNPRQLVTAAQSDEQNSPDMAHLSGEVAIAKGCAELNNLERKLKTSDLY